MEGILMAYPVIPNVPTSGVTALTPDRVSIGAGTVHKGLTWSSTSGFNFASSTLLFATGGGNTITITPTLQDVAPDDVWVRVQGLTIHAGETASITATPIEITPDLIQMSTSSNASTVSQTTPSATWAKYMPDTNIYLPEGSWIDDFAYVFTTVGGALQVITFPTAICTSGLSLQNQSQSKATPSVTIEAAQTLANGLATNGGFRTVGWAWYSLNPTS